MSKAWAEVGCGGQGGEERCHVIGHARPWVQVQRGEVRQAVESCGGGEDGEVGVWRRWRWWRVVVMMLRRWRRWWKVLVAVVVVAVRTWRVRAGR